VVGTPHGSPIEGAIFGRDREVDQVDELIRSIDLGARFVVIRGEAGIGKTALWRSAVVRHRAAGHLALVTRPTEEELYGPAVGLADLFGDIDEGSGVLAEHDRFERGRYVLDTLRRLAAHAPVVVAIDDVQWVDPVSAGALRYAFRRLEREPVLVLATERSDRSLPPDDRTIPPDRREEIYLGPLSVEATRLVVSQFVDPLPRPRLERVHELSVGNPMYAIELARSIDLFDDSLTASVPPTLSGALSSRVGAIPDSVRELLCVAAALGAASVQTIARASDDPDAVDLVAGAVADDLLIVGDDLVVRFAHPLLASVVLAGLNPVERQALHARLADTVDDPDSRARHLALSCDGPDADVAVELQDAAARAARRGASSLAAYFAEHSVRVTPLEDVENRIRRAFAAVLHRAAAGDKSKALAEADRLVAMLPAGPIRAEAIAARVAIDFDGGDGFLEQAAAEAGDDEALLGRILELRGWLAVIHRAELHKGRELAERALTIAIRLHDETLEMLASSTVASACMLLGRPRDDLMDRALHLAATNAGTRLGRSPQGVHGRHCLWCGRLPEARTVLEDLYRACLRGNIEFQRPYRILDLAAVEIASGNLSTATKLLDEGFESALDAGNNQAAAWLAYPVGVLNAHLGESHRAREAAATLRARSTEQDGRTRLVMAGHVLGLLALADADPATATAELAVALEMADDIGVGLPSVVPVLPDAIEAAALVGDTASCSQLSAELDRQAAAVSQPWVDAAALRGRGLTAMSEGRVEAVELLGDAARAFDALGYRLDAARGFLLQGRALRRAGRRNASADVLADAHGRFVAMGAMPWAIQAEAELERVAPGREHAELTPTESQIAELVVCGRRNREIANELFVSVATVEAHLTRIYRKLHVRSRTELARVVQAER
jgi:DNA-binding CsgD family transcriptional regulator